MACKKCKGVAAIHGIEDAPFTEIGIAIVTAVATAQIAKAVTTNADGTPRDNFLAKNPLALNALYLGGGIWLTSMEGEMYKGSGMGLAVYGGFGLIDGLMKQFMPTVGYIPPQAIAGMTLENAFKIGPSSYGIQPSLIADDGRYQVPHPQTTFMQEMVEQQQEEYDDGPQFNIVRSL